jgi:hypothetical protein
MPTLYFRNVGTAWNNNTSWSSGSTTGVSAGVIPTGFDDVIFDANSAASCPVTTTIGICRDLTTTGYTGTITLNVDLQVRGNIITGSGTVFSGTSWFTIAGQTPAVSKTMSSNGVFFPNFQLGVGGPPAHTLTFNDVLNVNNIRHAVANAVTTNANSVNVNGSMTMENVGVTWVGTTVYNLIGTGNFGMVGVNPAFGVTININTPSTITFLANVRLNGLTFNYISGNVNTTTNSSLFDLYANNTITSKNVGTGNEIVFNNVRGGFTGINGITTLGSDITIRGNLTVGDFNGYSFNNNVIYVQGNVINPNSNITNGGTSIVEMIGTGNTSITNLGATPSSSTGFLGRSLVINKTGATVSLIGNLTLNATGREYTVASGTFNPSVSTISLANNINATFNGFTFWNLTIPGVSVITQNATNTIQNNLTLASNGNVTFSGTAGWNCANLLCSTANRTITLQEGIQYNTSNNANMLGTDAQRITMQSSSGVNRAIWTLAPAATQSMVYVNGTRIDSSLGQTIWSFGPPVLTNTLNWNSGSKPRPVAWTFVN